MPQIISAAQNFVNRVAQKILMDKHTLPRDATPEERNNMILLGVVRGLTIMAESKGYKREDLHHAIDVEWELKTAAQARIKRD